MREHSRRYFWRLFSKEAPIPKPRFDKGRNNERDGCRRPVDVRAAIPGSTNRLGGYRSVQTWDAVADEPRGGRKEVSPLAEHRRLRAVAADRRPLGGWSVR